MQHNHIKNNKFNANFLCYWCILWTAQLALQVWFPGAGLTYANMQLLVFKNIAQSTIPGVYNPNTGVFTAPYTGQYQFQLYCSMGAISVT